MPITLNEIVPPAFTPTYSDLVSGGPPILPQNRIQLYNDTEWEQFTEEYAAGLKPKYIDVRRAGGAGDEGVDVAAYRTNLGLSGDWDNYQCKHYDHALYPSDIYLEMGKLCHYTFIKSYPTPKNYYFVAPHGVGTSLGKLIRGNHNELKQNILNDWGKYCENKITSKHAVLLIGEFKRYVEKFDFSIVKDISILELLEVHRSTVYYNQRFGGNLPSRPTSDVPPEEMAEEEVIYVKKLLEAYAEFLQISEISLNEVENHRILKAHLRSARIQFYCAESLHKFSRDYLEAGEFERLQDNIFVGIENIILSEHNNGFERVKNVVQEAYKIQIDSHPLKERLDPSDRGGICHQLANSNKLSWVYSD